MARAIKPGHSFTIGKAIRRENGEWVEAAAAWEAVVSRIISSSVFEYMDSGVLEYKFGELTPNETKYTSGGTAIGTAMDSKRLLLALRVPTNLTIADIAGLEERLSEIENTSSIDTTPWGQTWIIQPSTEPAKSILNLSMLQSSITGAQGTITGTLSTDRSYTVPDQNGTFALLEREQTFTQRQYITVSTALAVGDPGNNTVAIGAGNINLHQGLHTWGGNIVTHDIGPIHPGHDTHIAALIIDPPGGTFPTGGMFIAWNAPSVNPTYPLAAHIGMPDANTMEISGEGTGGIQIWTQTGNIISAYTNLIMRGTVAPTAQVTDVVTIGKGRLLAKDGVFANATYSSSYKNIFASTTSTTAVRIENSSTGLALDLGGDSTTNGLWTFTNHSDSNTLTIASHGPYSEISAGASELDVVGGQINLQPVFVTILEGADPTAGSAGVTTIGGGAIYTDTASFTGDINIHGVSYVWPSSSASGVLTNDGSGILTWDPASGSGITALTGAITASGSGSVAASLGTFTFSDLNTAVSDAELARTDDDNTFIGAQSLVGISTASEPTVSSADQIKLYYNKTNQGLYASLNGADYVSVAMNCEAEIGIVNRLTKYTAGNEICISQMFQEFGGGCDIIDGEDFRFSAVTGSMIGTLPTEKIGLWGATPVVQQTGDILAALSATGVIASPVITGFKRGTGSPEGAVTSPIGDIFERTDGGTGTTLYIKESGAGNTGWRAFAAPGISALTGDVTASGSGSVAATIANDAVTYAKIQNISGASLLLGRGSASGSGDTQEITVGTGLSMSGTTLSTTGGSVSGLTTGKIPKAASSTSLNDSVMSQSSTHISIAGASGAGPATGTTDIGGGVIQTKGSISTILTLVTTATNGPDIVFTSPGGSFAHLGCAKNVNSGLPDTDFGIWAVSGKLSLFGNSATEMVGFTDTTASFSIPITLANAMNVILGTGTGTKIGTGTTQKLAFHNSTPVVQRSGADQTAVVTTAATNITPYGYATQAQADALVTLVNELRAAMVEKGLIKGSA